MPKVIHLSIPPENAEKFDRQFHELTNVSQIATLGRPPLPLPKDWPAEATHAIHYTPPLLAGCEFAALIEPTTLDASGLGTATLIHKAPGVVLPAGLTNKCDVCRKASHRKQTFLVTRRTRHGATTYNYVGRACLADFQKNLLGHTNSSDAESGRALCMQEFIRECEAAAELGNLVEAAQRLGWAAGYWMTAHGARFDLTDFVAWTISVVEKQGWRPKNQKTKGYITKLSPTADVVLKLVTPPGPAYDRYPELLASRAEALAKYAPTETHRRYAAAAVAWARDMPESKTNAATYFANLNAVARGGYADAQTAGLCASLFDAWRKDAAAKTPVAPGA